MVTPAVMRSCPTPTPVVLSYGSKLFDDASSHLDDTPQPLPSDPLSVEEQVPDDSAHLERLNDISMAEPTNTTIIQTIPPPSDVEAALHHDEDTYTDPILPSRKSSRIRRPTRHHDESNLSEFTDRAIDSNTPFPSVTHVAMAAQEESAKLNDMEGVDPADFLPEPQSLKSLAKLNATI